MVNHFSRLKTQNHMTEGSLIKVTFLDKQLLAITNREMTWHADYVNYLASGELPPDVEPHARKNILRGVRSYVWMSHSC